MPATVESFAERLNPIDSDRVAAAFGSASPTRFFCIDDFLTEDFARRCAAEFPSYDEARSIGQREFRALSEDVKVQVTDSARFPAALRELHETLSSAVFLEEMTRLTGIPRLLADPELAGGGLHVMGAGGRLDVHVDFNLLRRTGWHRRLNILVYLRPGWDDAWGGEFQIWDPDVKKCLHEFAPRFNRCVVFNTTEQSFHGVNPIRCPEGVTRNSFAAFYYTEEPPEGWDGRFHTSVYRARPSEWWRGHVLMPGQRVRRSLRSLVNRTRRKLRGD